MRLNETMARLTNNEKEESGPASTRLFYSDVRRNLDSHSSKYNMAISTTLPGAIPSKTRAIINDATSKGGKNEAMFDEVFLLLDASECKIEKVGEKPQPAPIDPLLVGYRANFRSWKSITNAPGLFFLLDVFDATPLEKYIADEFSTNP
jgi:hypothetical protein